MYKTKNILAYWDYDRSYDRNSVIALATGEGETGSGPSGHSPGVGQGVVEEDELVVVGVAVELSPDGVLKSGNIGRD